MHSAHRRCSRGLLGGLRKFSLPASSRVIQDFAAALRPSTPSAGEREGLPEECVSIVEATRLLGRKQVDLVSARRRKILLTRFTLREGIIGRAFDRAEIEELSRVHADRVGLDAAAYSFKLPGYAMPQLGAVDLIDLEDHAWWLDQLGSEQTTGTAVAALRERLLDARSPVEALEQPVHLSRVMTGVGGRPKPWGPVFRALVEGAVPFSVGDDVRVNRISIPAATAELCRNHRSGAWAGRYTQRDALEILNAHIRQAGQMIPFCERTSRNAAWHIGAAALEELAREGVSAGELSSRTGLHPTAVSKLLIRLGANAAWIGWDRQDAQRRLGDHLGIDLANDP